MRILNRLVTKSFCWSAGLIAFANSIATACYAQTNPETSSPNGSSDIPGVSSLDTFKMIVQVIFFLIIIIGLFLLIIKFISKKNKLFTLGRSFRSLGGVPLGTNKSIQVIELGNVLYVVGVGENIQLLEKIDRQEDVEAIRELLASPLKAGQDFDFFISWFKRLRGRQEDETSTSSFQEVFLSKMQNVANRKKMVEDLLMDDQKKDRLNDK
jgi:flagellar protein FliO/FliZ